MNYENFSPECKNGIEQFRKWITFQKKAEPSDPRTENLIWDDHAGIGPCITSRNIPFKENSALSVSYLTMSELFVSTLVLNGTSLKEANEALKFADEKYFWRKDVFYLLRSAYNSPEYLAYCREI